MNETKFDGMGKIYAQFRPSYPDELFDYLYTDGGIKKSSVIADIGSGTGKLTMALLEKGNTVFAVEPNEDMRKVAEQNLKAYDGFVSVNSTAENTGLKEASIDIITVAQAFHWFDRQRFRAECKRVLKPGGMVVLVYNRRNEKSEQARENYRISKKYCPAFGGFSGGMSGEKSKDDFSDFFCGEYEVKEFNNDLVFDEEGFIGRNLSGSYALKENDEGYTGFIEELKGLFEKFSENGCLTMSNFTRSYIGKV